jgi:NAD(P)-dependent dehydrogenase (short-subunit alcohol dehydrogenase family)
MTADTPLAGQTALVTGAATGIGQGTARMLARDGADVVGADIDGDRLEETVAAIESEFGVDGLAVQTDVTERSQVASMVEQAVERFGGLDVVVNNAGITLPVDVEEMSYEEYHREMDINVDGMFFTTKEALPYLKESEGNIVFIGSFAGQYPRPFAPVYAGTKWWTRGFAFSLAGNVGEEGVAVSVVNPSETRSDIAEGLLKDEYDDGEITHPDEIGEAVAFAARQEQPNTASEIDLFTVDKFSGF